MEMARGHRKQVQQSTIWVDTRAIPTPPAHPFYAQINAILAKHNFDEHVDQLAAPYYADHGRPSIPVGNYFRLVLIGYFENLPSQRAIAWRVADSLSLRRFLALALTDDTPDHSSLTVIRKRLPLEVHQQVFQFVLTILAREGALKGKVLGLDATTIEANAALRELTRKDTGERYHAYVKRLAEEAGEPAQTFEEIARFDKKRKGKKLSNEEWEHPHDSDARVGRDKHGATDMLYKLEKADDLETGAILSVTVQTADTGDTTSQAATLDAAVENMAAVLSDEASREMIGQEHAERAEEVVLQEVVEDKGYHSDGVLKELDGRGMASYVSVPRIANRNWSGKEAEQARYEVNRIRVESEHGKELLRKRGEISERGFAHLCDVGGTRRTWLRGVVDNLKKALGTACGFNLGLLVRRALGAGKPKELAEMLGSEASSCAFGTAFRCEHVLFIQFSQVSAQAA
jgi:transposase